MSCGRSGDEMPFQQRSSLARQHSDEILTLISGDGHAVSDDGDVVSDDSGYDPADSSFSNGGGRENDELDHPIIQGRQETNSLATIAATAEERKLKSDAAPTTPTPRGALTTIGSLSARSPVAHTSLNKFYNTSTLPLTDDDEDDEDSDDGCGSGEFHIEDIPKVRYDSISRIPLSDDVQDGRGSINANEEKTDRNDCNQHKNGVDVSGDNATDNVLQIAKERARRELRTNSVSSPASQAQSPESKYPLQNAKEESKASYPSQDGKQLPTTNEGEIIRTSQEFPQKQQLPYASSPNRASEKGRISKNESPKDKTPRGDYSIDDATARSKKGAAAKASKSQKQEQEKDQSDSKEGARQPKRRQEEYDTMLAEPLGEGLEGSTSTMVVAAMEVPDLNRDSRYTPSPGAQRVRGICAEGDEDLDDYDFENDFDYQNDDGGDRDGVVHSNDHGDSDALSPPPTDRPSRGVSLANADNPIEAMLVDENAQHAIDSERERELRDREAAIKAKEKELEEQMASLRAAQSQVVGNVIQATAVDHVGKGDKKKKKGIKKIFNLFSRSSKESSESEYTNDVKNAMAPASPQPQTAMVSPAPTHMASPTGLTIPPISLQRQTSDNIPLPSSLSRNVSGSTGSSGRSFGGGGLVRHSSEGTVMTAAQVRPDPHRLPNLRIPLVSMTELQIGKAIKSGRFNTAYWIQGIDLEDATGKQLLKDVSQSLLNSNDRSNLIDNMPRIQAELRQALSCQINQDCGKKGTAGWKRGNKNKKSTKFVMKMLNSDDHKMLDPRLRTRAAAQLAHEATLLSHFDHDHLISLAGMTSGFSVTTPNENFFCVFEYIPETLDMHLTKRWKRGVRGPQQFAERVKAAVQLASAIDYLHSINVMFSDLKPENVGFVTGSPSSGFPDGEQCLKLFNFGGAKSLMGRAQVSSYDLVATTTSPFVGCHPYVAPEVVYQRPSGLAIDTYAFAIILWEIMTLKEPFAGLMIHEYKDKVIRGNKRPKLDKTPKELHNIMTSCWDAHAMKRPCMKDVHLHLVQFQQEVVTAEMKKGGFR